MHTSPASRILPRVLMKASLQLVRENEVKTQSKWTPGQTNSNMRTFLRVKPWFLILLLCLLLVLFYSFSDLFFFLMFFICAFPDGFLLYYFLMSSFYFLYFFLTAYIPWQNLLSNIKIKTCLHSIFKWMIRMNISKKTACFPSSLHD